MVADPKILYWVSGIVVALLVMWVGFVNVRLESRGQGAKAPRRQGAKPQEKAPAPPKKDEKKETEEDNEDDEDDEAP